MANTYDDMQKMMKDNLDAMMRSAGAVSRGVQAMAVEMSDYSKKTVEDGSRYVEKLLGAKSLDAVLEVQTEYMKKSYEEAVGKATRFGELYADLAKEMTKPYESFAVGMAK